MPRHDPVPGAAAKRDPARLEPAKSGPDHDAEIRRRQRARSIVTAAILFALVALFYAISIAKML